MKIELRDIHKHFGSLRANDGVTLSVAPGTIHGLLGENGAGKSTLMKILNGFIAADSGEILLDGKPVTMTSPAQAVTRGVGMLYQDPLDFSALTVLDNFVLGSPGGLVPDRGRARRELRELLNRFDFTLDPDTHVSDLSIGERQQLEISRLLWLGARTLVLDEPTTAISAQQRDKLFATLRKLAQEGMSVIFVSHKLEEVEALCDEVTVLNRGRVTGQARQPYATDKLVQMMFGQNIPRLKRQPQPVQAGGPQVQLDRVTVSDWRLELQDLRLDILPGEVIGLAGLEGSGQLLLLQTCCGLRAPSAGRVRLAGVDMTGQSYHRLQKVGVAYMPAGRLEEGLIAGMTLTEHVALAEHKGSFFVNWSGAAGSTAKSVEHFHIKGRPASRIEELSGGNQQRTLLALLPPQLKLLLMEHPTRGLDIESVEYIWKLLLERTKQGTAIIFLSSDLEELLDRSDRILVFFGGQVAAPLDARRVNVEQLGELIGGKGFTEGGAHEPHN
ncbi:MAG: ATP-binding cassette domain-containing protein [Chloroflexi bacterium]|nr:ATP-binding cassette domain-containing protein [Chloroflexota bacterium]